MENDGQPTWDPTFGPGDVPLNDAWRNALRVTSESFKRLGEVQTRSFRENRDLILDVGAGTFSMTAFMVSLLQLPAYPMSSEMLDNMMLALTGEKFRPDKVEENRKLYHKLMHEGLGMPKNVSGKINAIDTLVRNAFKLILSRVDDVGFALNHERMITRAVSRSYQTWPRGLSTIVDPEPDQQYDQDMVRSRLSSASYNGLYGMDALAAEWLDLDREQKAEAARARREAKAAKEVDDERADLERRMKENELKRQARDAAAQAEAEKQARREAEQAAAEARRRQAAAEAKAEDIEAAARAAEARRIEAVKAAQAKHPPTPVPPRDPVVHIYPGGGMKTTRIVPEHDLPMAARAQPATGSEPAPWPVLSGAIDYANDPLTLFKLLNEFQALLDKDPNELIEALPDHMQGRAETMMAGLATWLCHFENDD